jgi:hypothetical protein
MVPEPSCRVKDRVGVCGGRCHSRVVADSVPVKEVARQDSWSGGGVPIQKCLRVGSAADSPCTPAATAAIQAGRTRPPTTRWVASQVKMNRATGSLSTVPTLLMLGTALNRTRQGRGAWQDAVDFEGIDAEHDRIDNTRA